MARPSLGCVRECKTAWVGIVQCLHYYLFLTFMLYIRNIYMCVYICMHLCMYVYVYMYIHIYITAYNLTFNSTALIWNN